MEPLRPLAPAYRAAAVATAVSVVLHGTALVGIHSPGEGDDASLEVAAYTARLEPAATVVEPPPAPASAPPPRPRARAKPLAPRPEETVAYLPAAIEAADLEPVLPEAHSQPLPEMVALVQPVAPSAPPETAPLPLFRPEALPGEVTIAYALTSAFADGQAEYTWERDGDRYEITGSLQATGFFAVFLEGSIDQAAKGRVTPKGLRPELFVERRPSTAEEGLAFDWDARTVEFRRENGTRTAPLADSTVDWLSMIFQLAHMPPKGDSMDLQVFTQRRMYQYRLQVLGYEELDLPFGRANTLHLRHTGEKPEEVVDVWLGVDQYHLPVKLRYPVARNRLVIEQTATSVRAR